MPQFELNGRDNPAFKRCSTLEQAYIEALFFADTPEDEEWSFDDLSESALRKIKEDCATFLYRPTHA